MANVELTGNFLATARCLIFADSASGVWSFNPNTNTLTINAAGGGTGSAAPTAKVGLTVVNGSASTWMRSDAAPPIDQAIIPTWTGLHTFSNGLTVSGGSTTISGYVLTLTATASVGGTNTGDQTLPVGANPSAKVGATAVNGTATTWMRSDGAPAIDLTFTPTWTGAHQFTPGSGVGITITQNHGTQGLLLNGSAPEGLRINTTAAAGSYMQLYNNGTFNGFIGDSSQQFSSGALGNLGIGCNTGKQIDFGISATLAVSINGVTTTGAQTASMAASNKPGSAGATTPISWLPVKTAAGVQGYIPIYGA